MKNKATTKEESFLQEHVYLGCQYLTQCFSFTITEKKI